MLGRFFLVTTILIFLQLILGATMRHQHAGLAIPDFPLAYGKLWPDMDAEAVARYNAAARRGHDGESNHGHADRSANGPSADGGGDSGRRVAGRGVATRRRGEFRRRRVRRLAFTLAGLILIQAGLGAWTIWSNKAADVATAHVLVGALSLVTGVFGCIICFAPFSGGNCERAVARHSQSAINRIARFGHRQTREQRNDS